MSENNNGYARTEYAEDPWWFRFTKKWLGHPKSTYLTDVDIIRFRLVEGVLIFALIESKCLTGRRMKTSQQKTFQMLHQQLYCALNNRETPLITFTVKGKEYTYPIKYGGTFLCNSFACNEECNDLLDVDENPTTDEAGILFGEAYTVKLDLIIRHRDGNWLMLIRRFDNEVVDTKTAFILRVIEAVIRRHETTGKYQVDDTKFHGLHLLQYDSNDLDRAAFRWDGKPSDLREVVDKMTFGKVTDAAPPPVHQPVLSIKD